MRTIPLKIWLLILAMTIVRLIIACTIELGNDEVYYWTYALDLNWSYFDHPPIVGWLIRLTTANLWFHHEIAVRMGAIVSSAICTLTVYKIGSFLGNDRVGWYSALMYSASFYCSVISGTFILPDSPQLFFWLSGILLLLKIDSKIDHNLPTLKLWCWFGLVAGLCIMCKVHGVYLWITVILYAVLANRKFFYQRGMYVSIMISLVIVSPILIWNIQHNFITYTYHGSRVSIIHAGFHPFAFIREVFGEVFYNNPIVFVLAWSGVFAVFRGRYYGDKKKIQLLLTAALPLIFTLLLLSLFKETLPHWSGPAYTCLIFLSALKMGANEQNKLPKSMIAALFFFFSVIITGISIVNFYSGSLSPNKDTMQYGKGDPTLDIYGWRETGRIIDSVYRSDRSKSRMPAIAPIVVNKWFPAAHLDFYVAAKVHQNTYAIGDLFDLHQYYWLNATKRNLALGASAYYIVPSNLYNERDTEIIKSHFKIVEPVLIIPIYRNGIICKNILLYRLKGYKKLII